MITPRSPFHAASGCVHVLALQVVPSAQVREMTVFKPLSFGWAKGFISYGTGLMVEAATMTDTFPPVYDELGTYMSV